MITINRADLYSWVEGTLLHFENGVGFAVDEVACEKVEAALDRGETVYLTDRNGKFVSKMVSSDKGNCEEELTDEDRATITKHLIG